MASVGGDHRRCSLFLSNPSHKGGDAPHPPFGALPALRSAQGVRYCHRFTRSMASLREPFSPARGEITSPPWPSRFPLRPALALLVHRILVGAGAGAGADDGAGVV